MWRHTDHETEMAKKNEKMEEEIKVLKKHVGGLVKTILDLKQEVEALKLIYDEKKINELLNILENQKTVDVAITANADAIAKLDKEILSVNCKKQKEGKGTSDNKTSESRVGKITKKKCRYYNRGYCKYKFKCRYSHPEKVCEEYLKSMKCENTECGDRHPKVCKWMDTNIGCKRQSECDYLHVTLENEAIGDLDKFVCISCKHIWNDRTAVVEHILGDTQTFFCLNCDDWVQHKTKVLEQGWTLLDMDGYLRMDV